MRTIKLRMTLGAVKIDLLGASKRIEEKLMNFKMTLR